jgi:hypothetical protein
MITLGDYSWLAGVLDIKARWSSERTSISVGTPSQALALAVADLLGVAAVESRGVVGGYDRKGCATHCPGEHVHVEQARPSYTVRVTGIAAVIVAGTLHTRLRAAAPEAQELVRSYLAGTRPNSGMVTTVVDRMARLGWDVPEWAR